MVICLDQIKAVGNMAEGGHGLVLKKLKKYVFSHVKNGVTAVLNLTAVRGCL